MASAGNSSAELTSRILHALSTAEPVLTSEAFPDVPFAEIKAAVDSLSSKSMITYKPIEKELAILESEGELIAAHGSHEARVFEAVLAAMEGLTIPEIEKAIGDKTVTKLGQGKACKEKWISRTKDGKFIATVCHPFSPSNSNPAILVPRHLCMLFFFFFLPWRFEPLARHEPPTHPPYSILVVEVT